MKMGSFRFGALVGALAFIAGCNGGSVSAPNLLNQPAQHLYVPDDNTNGTVRAYQLPITSSSLPVASSAGLPHGATSAAVSATANALAVADISGAVMTFTLPLTASAAPAATFQNSVSFNDGEVIWSASGVLYVPTLQAPMEIFSSPFSNSSVPTGNIATTLTSADGAAYDNAGNLYITDAGSSTIAVWNGSSVSTTTVSPAVTGMRGAAVAGTQLFVGKVTAPAGVLVFNLPLLSGTPAFTITNGLNIPEGLAVDAHGNLYVADLGTSDVNVFTPPFSSGSSPAVVLNLPGVALFNIGIGK